MGSSNRFFKLLMFSLPNGTSALLYGFSSDTEQEPYAWRRRTVGKTMQSICTAILDEEAANAFERSLTNPGRVSIGSLSFDLPGFEKRAVALVRGDRRTDPGPTSGYRYVTEYWNIDKRQLLSDVESAFSTSGKDLLRSVQSLFAWAKEESGVDFANGDPRLGNFESYRTPTTVDSFEIVTHPECNLTKTTVRKVAEFTRPVIVNCTAEHGGRIIANQTKTLRANEESVDFTANEPMGNVSVQVWDSESGQLLFSKFVQLALSLHLNLSIGSSPSVVTDPWTEKLIKSAPNRKNDVENKIKTITRHTQHPGISINSKTRSAIDAARDEGAHLVQRYKRKPVDGAFISNIQKDGEIDSFLKVKEYIEADDIQKVIIADPYFSVTSAAKLLGRISNSDVQLDIITSLGDVNPDDPNENADVVEKYKRFLKAHQQIIHGKLLVKNLRRGSGPVFHDRYLIRYHQNGVIDGFLLSNSLNAMGKNYPFVIAPMAHEVCLDVCEYLERMCDADIQSKARAKERISCEILFDSNSKTTQHKEITAHNYLWEEWLAPWRDERRAITAENVLNATAAILSHWDSERKDVCMALGQLAVSGYSSNTRDLLTEAQKNDDFVEHYVSELAELARAEEERQKSEHIKEGIDSSIYRIWAMLTGQAKPSRQGFHAIFEDAGHIWYHGISWLSGAYSIALALDPKHFMELLNELKSPLMFNALAKRILFCEWNDELYDAIVSAEPLCVRLLGAEWINRLFERDKISVSQIQDILMQLDPEKRALQSSHLLSRIVLDSKAKRSAQDLAERRIELIECLLTCCAESFSNCSADARDAGMYWLYSSSKCTHCALHLETAYRATDPTSKDALLKSAVSIAEQGLLGHLLEQDVPVMVDFYLQGMEALFGADTEKQVLSKMIRRDTFETATEPELANYAYEKWSEANKKAKLQLLILRGLLDNRLGTEKTQALVDQWERMLVKVEM